MARPRIRSCKGRCVMNCKPGDLAIIVRSEKDQLCGKVVKVIKGWGDWKPYGYLWTVEFAHPIATRRPSQSDLIIQSNADFPDAWLRPVSGLPLTDDVSDDLRIKEPA